MLRREVQSAVAELALAAPMPAVAIGVTTATDTVLIDAWGSADLTTGEPVTLDHCWDLASLTKTLVTLPEVLQLVDQCRLHLDLPLAQQWPQAVGSDIGAASLRQILSYDAGMPWWRDFYRFCATPQQTRAEVLATPADRPAGSEPMYSDLGAMVCGFLVQDLAGPLPALAAQRSGLRFGVLDSPVVATERCPWRGRILPGEVHDENAAALGGVAGHAGAFGTVTQVLAALRWWMQRTTTLGTVWQASVTEQSRNSAGERFGLGWWLPPTRGIGGAHPGPGSWGMSGFVGNRIWVEPANGYGVVVLSNRVHPHRGDRAPFNAWCDRLLAVLADCFT